ncbi:MAG: hypothetical protein WCG25_08235 [bacterium]
MSQICISFTGIFIVSFHLNIVAFGGVSHISLEIASDVLALAFASRSFHNDTKTINNAHTSK